MPSAATLLLGRPDPLAILEAMATDLVARGAMLPSAAETAKLLVSAGRLPSTALLEVGAQPDFVLLALSSVAGVPPAPPRAKWALGTRSTMPVDDRAWQELLAVPVGTSGARPLVAFADVARIASHAALALPDHAACVALEADVRDALASSVGPVRSAVAFLAPPDAVARAMRVAPSAFSAPTKDAPAAVFGGGGTLLGTPPVAAPASPIVSPTPSSPPIAPPPFAPPSFAPPSPSSSPSPSPLPRTPSGTLMGTGAAPLSAFANAGGTGASGTIVVTPMTQSSSPPNAHAPAHAIDPLRGAPAIGPGVRCGRYVLDRLLGQGGMATVYLAHDVVDGTGAQAAIKVVHDFLLRSNNGEELRKRFEREVRAMRSLEHPNIVACLDAGRVGDTEYIATEFVAGGSLSGLLTSTGRLPPMLALCFFDDLLQGLAHAHDKGVIHRDLKPDNLLLDPSGALKVADFGIARVQEGTALTETGRTVGTPAYMSPEQATAGTLDARSDLYSAGVILYEALTGRNPFEADSIGATLANVMMGRVTPVAEIEPAVPFLVDTVLQRLLPYRPDDRLSSARATLSALEPVLVKARAFRAAWSQLVQARATNTDRNALRDAQEREAAAFATFARTELNRGDVDTHRMRAGYAAYRATTIVPDHKEARAVLSSATKSKPLRFARSTTPALLAKESALDSLVGTDRNRAHRDIARMYFDEANPALAAAHGRRAILTTLDDDEGFTFLRNVLPDDEVDDVRTLPDRIGARSTMMAAAWKPSSPKPNASSPSPSTTPNVMVHANAPSSSSPPAHAPRSVNANIVVVAGAAIVIALIIALAVIFGHH